MSQLYGTFLFLFLLEMTSQCASISGWGGGGSWVSISFVSCVGSLAILSLIWSLPSAWKENAQYWIQCIGSCSEAAGEGRLPSTALGRARQTRAWITIKIRLIVVVTSSMKHTQQCHIGEPSEPAQCANTFFWSTSNQSCLLDAC